MSAALARAAARPKTLGVALVIVVASLGATPAFAAPEWGITMTHANAYGQQVSECPGGTAKYVPGAAEEDCGVDPFTGSGTSFDRGSGGNVYVISVSNTAPKTIQAGIPVGATLSCVPGQWKETGGAESPSFGYRWLRDGTAIAGAEGSEYETEAADSGAALQCEVTATGTGGAAMGAATAAVVVAPLSTTAPPMVSTRPEVDFEGGAGAIGKTRICTSGTWSGSPTISYGWLRNGARIPGAESNEYTLSAKDEGTAVQCQVTATNAGGSVVAENPYFTWVETEPPTPFTEYDPGPAILAPPPPNETRGDVTVADQLPAGLELAPTGEPSTRVSGAGWSCAAPTTAAFTCTRSDGLEPQSSYPPITAFVHVRANTADSVTNRATVAGGGARAETATAQTAIATVPFGLDTFTTSVTSAGFAPFTQAGGHPVAANSTFLLNYIPSALGTKLMTAGGTAADGVTLKEAEAELPPGFVGGPQNAAKCTTPEILVACPVESIVGYTIPALGGGEIIAGRAQPFYRATEETSPIWNLAPQPGHTAEFGFIVAGGVPLVLQGTLRSNGDYGITIGDEYAARNGPNPLGLSLTLCSNGVTGTFANNTLVNPACAATLQAGITGPFLTAPTQCSGRAPVTTMRVDSWEDPAEHVSMTVYNGTSLVNDAPSATESFVTGCSDLQFQPEVEFKPSSGSEGGTSQADEPTGASFALKVPQTNEPGVNATPELKDATVTLPEGTTVDSSAASGLQACSDAQFGLGSTVEPAEPAACPLASQVGTVKIVTPLLEKPLEGQVFLGEPECSPCSNTDAVDGRIFRLFLQVRSVERGVIVKLAGHVTSNPMTGRLQATFTEQPQLPFSELLLTFNGGARASLANPQTCGTFTTTTDLTPWSTPGLGGLSGTEAIAGTPDATPSSSFNVDWNGAGGACPATMPFSPSFNAGSQTPTAGASSPFAVTIGREDREQGLSGITMSTPPGLLGKIAGIPQCPEAQANAGTCGPESQIGTTTVGAGPGPHPFYLGGSVYLTGPYKGQPFGLSIVTPAVAGPFNLGTVVVRAAIAMNPSTAALTIVSDPLPQFVDGVQLRLRTIHVEVNRPGFMLNPTSCAGQAVGASITGAQGAVATLSRPFEVGGCQDLAFSPSFSASTQGSTSKAHGASLTITVKSAAGQANIGKVDLQLPKALPARLIPTLQKACTEARFNANPAGCPVDSFVGTATAVTPILNAPLSGPAILVSHGGAAFPDLEFLLQGENDVQIILDGKTDIKGGITYSKFESVPDAPISSFVTTLPESPHSILAAPGGDLCGKSLVMPTTITAQNGKQIIQKTKITVTGCAAVKTKPLTRAQKLKRALHVCRAKYKATGKKTKRLVCERQARQRYGPIKKAKKANRRGK